MNLLKIRTVATTRADTFLVYWTNTLMRPKGVLKVHVTAKREDRHVIAELAAMQHLLEIKGVIGNTLVGNANTQLIVSLGAIRKLQSMKSDKAHLAPYAHFLTTRFAGCPVKVINDDHWFEEFPIALAEDLLVSEPRRETITLTGYGEVIVTHHVLEKIAARLLPEGTRTAQAAWKLLLAVAADTSIQEVTRHSPWVAAKYQHEGRYFLNNRRDLVMVVTDKPGEGKRLVTAYRTTGQFHQLAKAA